jgi:spore coat polysaccharide biosynthesis protein SpsF (cytidylyltransferase family)
MRVGAIVFARMSSRRLPGKALLPVGRRPLLAWVLARTARAAGIAQVVVATSTDAADDAVEEFAQESGVAVYRGSLDNVVARALACARHFDMSAFARVCGDRVFLEPADIQVSVRRMISDASVPVDLVTNTLGGPVPPGLTTEVVRTEALARVLAQTSDAADLEHLTRYFYRRADRFRIVDGAPVPAGVQDVRVVVDTPEDLERARFIVERLDDPAAAPLPEIAMLARAWDAHRQGRQYA